MTCFGLWLRVLAVLFLLTGACSSQEPGDTGSSGPGVMMGGAGTPGGAAAGSGTSGDQGSAGASGSGQAGGSPGQPTAGTSGPSGGSDGAAGQQAGTDMLDPNTDWTALQLIFPVMYSAYDGVHTFQVPARADGVSVELSDWQAIPSSAVSFDPDPEGGGVLITIHEPVPEVTIAVSSGGIGGTASLYITQATPEDWEAGAARYDNGVDYEMPMISFADLFNPNYVPPETPDNIACNNCHTTGAKYFEIQHTPTQIAYISNENLRTILLEGMKPEGVEFSLLPPQLEYLYPEFHTWEASEEEILGLIVYLRSLTPTGQGDIMIPGTFTP